MGTSARVKAAFKAMKNIGIPEDKTKTALKKLLKLFDKNWDMIEEENYRVLADTIFEYDEAAEKEKKRKTPDNAYQGDTFDEAAPAQEEEPETPLKRSRHIPASGASALKIPKPEPGEPEASPSARAQPTIGSPQSGSRRTESQPVSPQALVRNKGKQPVSAHNVEVSAERPQPLDKRVAAERPPQALQLKEPKTEPGTAEKKKQPHINALIKPKDEPFTDDMMSLQPLAVVLPERMNKEARTISTAPVGSQDFQESRAFKSANGNNNGVGILTEENQLQEADVSEKAPAKIDIASSPMGEVKISLCCDHGTNGHDFHVPDLAAVLKKVNDNCLRTYKIMDPEFSITKVMREFCGCVAELGANANGVTEEGCNGEDAKVVDENGTCGLPSSNISIIKEFSDIVAARPCTGVIDDSLPSASKCLQMHSNDNGADDFCAERDASAVDVNMKSIVVVHPYDANDITRGEEVVKVSLERSNCEFLPSFHYIPQNVVWNKAAVNFSLAEVGDQDCCLSCRGDCLTSTPSCICAQQNGGDSPYTSEGLVREEFLDECISMVQNPQKHFLMYCKECPLEKSKNEDMVDPCKGHLRRKFIKECGIRCGCSRYCGNRVVQRGLRCNLQVFWTPEGKGWGLRTLEELPKGSFVCEYVGEILTYMELHKRNLKKSSDKKSYSVLLDTDWGARALKDEEILCLDATYYGNIARFINHRCSDGNLIEIPVEVETPNHHYYRVALFTTRKVDALEELTWDCGVDFDDSENHIKAFSCLCGSQFCRNMKRSSRSRPALTL